MNNNYDIARFPIVLILTKLVFVAVALGILNSAIASDYDIKPRPAWVKTIAPDQKATDKDNQVSRGVYYLLADNQVKLSGNQKTFFRHYALKALNAQGLDQLGHVEIWFDPSYQKLTLHAVSVFRDNKQINKLSSAKIKILQREKELELRVYDGSKTANIFLEDIQVGDVLDYSYSITGTNPVFNQHQFGGFDLQWGVPVNHIFNRLVLPKESDVHFTYVNTSKEVKIEELGDEREYVWERQRVPALIVASETPSWHDSYPYVQWGDYKNWQTVAQWALPLYRVTSSPSKPLQQIINQIASKYSSAEERMLAALQFVQKEIRYLGVEIGANSHAPNPPELVLSRRFGDCKDKTLLTMTMLNALGIKAQAALVNTNLRRWIANLEPSPHAFNHVIVRAQVGGQDYWLDPTLQKQISSLKELYQPNYDYSLLVDAGSTALVPMPKMDSQIQKRKVHTLIDSSKGVKQAATLTIATTYQGISAENMRNSLATENLDDLQKRYMNYYARYYPSITLASPMTIEDDEKSNQLTTTEHYAVTQLWTRDEEKKRLESRYYSPEIDSLLTRPTQPIRTSPLALSHPIDLEQVTEVLLPEAWSITPENKQVEGPGFELKHEVTSTSKTLIMRDHYLSRTDQLMPEQVSKHVETIEQVKNLLGYSLWQNDQDSSAGDAGVAPLTNAATTLPSFFSPNFNWTIAVLAALLSLVWIQLAIKFYRYDPPSQSFTRDTDDSIAAQAFGGWLIIAMISITLTPLRILSTLLDVEIYSLPTWAVLNTPSSPTFYPAQIPIVIFELAGNLGIFIFTVLLATLFYKKRRTFPRAYAMIFGALILFHITDNVLAFYFVKDGQEAIEKDLLSLTLTALAYVLWAIYFNRSERAKATFINPYQHKHKEGTVAHSDVSNMAVLPVTASVLPSESESVAIDDVEKSNRV